MNVTANIPPIVADYINNINNTTLKFATRQNYRDLLQNIVNEANKAIQSFDKQIKAQDDRRRSGNKIRAAHSD